MVQKGVGGNEKSSMKTTQKIFEHLTFENLREWAGEKIYHRGEEYVDRVSQLSCTSDGAVAAWVAGTDDYATMVSRDEQGDLEAFCTCPYSGYGPCKHVVVGVLDERLAEMPLPKGDSFSARYRRQRLLDWLVTAYTRSGRREEVIPLLEREVEICENYQQLVDTLVAVGKHDQARR